MAVQDGGGEDPGQASQARYLAKCVLRSTVVLHAVYGHIRSPSTFDVVFGKETSLELVVVGQDGTVQSVCEQPVFGTIKDLRVLPWNECHRSPQPQTYGKDLLVLLSDSGKLSFLTFSIDLHRFLAVSHVHVSHPGNQRRELGRLLTVESRGRAIAVGAFEDRLAIFPTSISAGSIVVDKRMVYPQELIATPEASTSGVRDKPTGWGTIWSMAFVGMADETLGKAGGVLFLAVLVHRRGAVNNEVQLLMCDNKERFIQLKSRYEAFVGPNGLGPLGLAILEVPAAPGFALLSRSGDFLLLDLRTPTHPRTAAVYKFRRKLDEEDGSSNSVAASALLELLSRGRYATCNQYIAYMSDGETSEAMDVDGDVSSLPTITAWSWEPDGGDQPRLALAMDTGEIHIAQLNVQAQEGIPQIEVRQCQYRCSPCNVVLWTKGGFLAVLVEMGDGQVLRCSVSGTLTCCSLIQNLAPIVDFALVDYHGEKQAQMFACCGAGQEGSLRIVHNGISVEKLLTTSPTYQGVTGIYTMRMCRKDQYHAFFVMSFVLETRVLSVGLNFVDITDAIGFQPWASTLACGGIEDGFVAQVCSKEVRVCAPTIAAHPAGLEGALPLCSSWIPPQGLCISLGAVAHRTIILALSQPGLIVMLGTRRAVTGGVLEVFEIQQCLLEAELSCISIPEEEELVSSALPPSIVGLEGSPQSNIPLGVEVGKICVVGTHKPSVELLSIVPGKNFTSLAVGLVSIVNSLGTTLSDCVPESVRLAQFDRLYILSGLRNGMLLRYEWPTSSTSTLSVPSAETSLSQSASTELATIKPSFPEFIAVEDTEIQFSVRTSSNIEIGKEGVDDARPVSLNLVAVRRMGISPVSMIPLQASLRADIMALSDRPWLLQTATYSQRIAYTSISFQPSTHATPVSSSDCPNGILFVADCSLHLVEMEHSKQLNVQRLPLGRTPRRVLYHSDSKTLLVMRTDTPGPEGCHAVSDICCVDPLSGAFHSCFQLDAGETARCMQLWKLGNEQLLLVGTSITAGRAIMHSGEPESTKGRLLVFQLESRRVGGNSGVFPNSTPGIPASTDHPTPRPASAETMVISESLMTTDEDDKDGHRLAQSEVPKLRLKTHVVLPGMVLSVSPYLGQYVLASAGNNLCCLGFLPDSPQRLRRLARVRTRFAITSLSVHLNRIAVGECRDGVVFYSYQEDTCQLEQLHCDPVQRLVADCILMDVDTAIATDRLGNFCALSSANIPEDSTSPESNLALSSWYHVGETIMRICKASFAYRSSMEDSVKACSSSAISDFADSSVVASSLLGSVFIFILVTREEYEVLEAVQARLAGYPLTAPLLGNNHADFRSQGCPAGVCRVLDGDMLCQFLELTSTQQQAALSNQPSVASFGQNTFTPPFFRKKLACRPGPAFAGASPQFTGLGFVCFATFKPSDTLLSPRGLFRHGPGSGLELRIDGVTRAKCGALSYLEMKQVTFHLENPREILAEPPGKQSWWGFHHQFRIVIVAHDISCSR